MSPIVIALIVIGVIVALTMMIGIPIYVLQNMHSHDGEADKDKDTEANEKTKPFDDSKLSEVGKKCVDGAVYDPVTDTCQKMGSAEDVKEKCVDWNTGVEHYKTTDEPDSDSSALSADYNACQKRNACNVKHPDDGSDPKRLENYYNCVHSSSDMASLRAMSV